MWLPKPLLLFFAATIVLATPGLRASTILPASPDVGTGGKTIITGVQSVSSDGHVGVRREINDLKANYPDVWNVYILGLRSFQLANQSSPRSYYGIAAIHGMPSRAWEDVDGNGNVGGYCTHNGPLFLSWHRPYLALYEQELQKQVMQVALQFQGTLLQRFTAAANQFRIPYWDWGLTTSDVPGFFTSAAIDVVGIDGSNQTIPNPLYSYQFNPLIAGDFADKWATINATIRWPTTDAPDAVSQNDQFVQNFHMYRQSAHDEVSSGFSLANSFNDFEKTYLEVVHGWIHMAVGGSGDVPWGHMSPIEYSGYDPLFMVHHCNVDRLYALWQDAHPDQSLQNDYNGVANFWLNSGDPVNASTPLKPFWKSETTFWTTNDCWNTQVLGYVYPETMNWTYADAQSYGASVNATIARLYSNSARDRLTSVGSAGGGNFANLLEDGQYDDWSIDIQALQSKLPPSFSVQFFLVGTFSSDLVTSLAIWQPLLPTIRSQQEDKSKAKRETAVSRILRGHISLTSKLLDEISLGQLESLTASDVVPFLKGGLSWKVTTVNGTLIPSTQLESLTVQVLSTKVRIPNSPDLPLEYSAITTPYPDITSGKGGGVNA